MKSKNVEDIYQLSPMQQGMLFHTLHSPEAGEYVVQIVFTLEGKLRVGDLERSWQEVVDRHPVLRSAFYWKNLDKPVQVVHRQVGITLRRESWRDLPPSRRADALRDFLREDRRRGYEIDKQPLMRLTVIELDDDVHQFVWSHHHLLLDGWSLPLVLREVFAFYEGRGAGRSVSLPRPRRYRDYVNWFRNRDTAEAEAFWREELRGFESPTPLGVDRPRSEASEAEDETYEEARLYLPEAMTERLQEVARQRQLTFNTLLQGAWAVLLGRYSQKRDVVFGTTIAGRPPEIPGVESMVGLFINTLPMRVDAEPAGAVTAAEWLRPLQDHQSEAQHHGYCALLDIQGWSEIEQGTALFDSLLVYENFPVATAVSREASSLQLRDVLFLDRSNYPLTIKGTPGPRLRLRSMYRESRFDNSTVERLLSHLQVVLGALAEDVDRSVTELPILTPGERRQLLEWVGTEVAGFLAPCRLQDLVEAQVDRTPDAPALRFDDGTLLEGDAPEGLSYRQLDEAANRLAHHLLALGVRPDQRVGVMMERSYELVIALLAVVKAGAAWVPLDPDYPEDRLAFMLRDFRSGPGSGVLLSQSVLSERCEKIAAAAGTAVLVFAVDAEEETLAAASPERPSVAVGPDHAAYMIYTSGSTGRPKGAVNSHRGICHRLLWMQDAFRLTEEDRVLQKTPASFDVSVWEFFLPIMTGACLVVARPGGHQDPDYLVQVIRKAGITTMHFVPSMFRHFLEAPGVEELTALARVICSGEALTKDLTERFYDRLGASGAELHNLYGPTEAAVDVTWWRCEPGDDRQSVPIGRPIANTAAYVLDRCLRLVPASLEGELHLGGVQVSRGYLNRPGLMAERFIPDPFAAEQGGRLYKTGDLTRWLPGGYIEYLGRLDFQVKIRGFRIELGEIEATLSSHEAVRAAVVAADGSDLDDRRLVAYVVAAPDGRPTKRALRDFVGERLPDYMVPADFVLLDELPLTPNGKVDRRALAELSPDPEDEPSIVAPRTPLEEVVASFWAEVLDLELEEVSVDANFFHVGGHSLLAVRLLSQLRQTFRVELPFRSLFQTPTVAGLATLIEKGQREEHGTAAMPPITPAPRDEPLPLSFSQQRLWFLDQLQPDSTVYNLVIPMRFSGKVSFPVLRHTLNEMLRRHESLRTTIGTHAGQPVLVIHPFAARPLPVVDLSALPEERRLPVTRRLTFVEARRPIDLERGPLWRAVVLRLGEEWHQLVTLTHHVIFDGSIERYARELGASYEVLASGRATTLPDLDVQYADFAWWQRHWLSGETLEQYLGYWRQQLLGLTPQLELPFDRPRPPLQTNRGRQHFFRLSARRKAEMETLARQEGATLFMTGLAAFLTLLHRLSGQDDLSVGAPVEDRPHASLEEVIGCFVNSLVLRVSVEGTLGFRELLARVRETTLDAHAHRDMPFELLVEALDPQRDMSHNPLFQVMFTLQNVHRREDEAASSAVDLVKLDTRTARFDMMLGLWTVNSMFQGAVEYNTDLFDATTVQRMVGSFERILTAVVADPKQRLAELPLLSSSQRHELLVEWNDSRVEVPEGRTLTAWIESRVAADPRAVAVRMPAEGVEWTYGEVNRRANRLAWHLRRAGVGRGTLVGVHLTRSAEMVSAVLGVLKAGGAYVPIETSLPPERVAWLVSSLGIAHLLTQSRHVGALASLEAVPSLGRLICLDEGTPEVTSLPWGGAVEVPAGDLPEENPPTLAGPDDLAYVIFTSGSTGRPKGVMVSQAAVVNLIHWVGRRFGIGARDQVLFVTSLSFDLSVYDIFGLLAAGGSVRVASEEELRDPAALASVLRREDVTFWDSAPAALQQLVPFFAHPEEGAEPALRQVFLSGDWIPLTLPDQVRTAFPGAAVTSLGGATEATVWSNFFPVGTVAPEWVSIPYGRPMANARYHVLDAALGPVPIGVEGGLYIAGLCLARGYAGDPRLTAIQYVPDPSGREGGGRLYATGDRARTWHDGTIEFLGRRDFQVKIRGYRIELGEIETVLGEHPEVRDAVVLARDDAAGEKHLVAYVTAPPETGGPSAEQLGDYLRRRLPPYMVPAFFQRLDELPLTSSGKLDRGALPAPQLGNDGAATAAPRNPIEELVAGVYSEVLGHERIGIHDSFFHLGGESLKATRLVSRVRETFGVELPVRAVFERPTVAELSEAVAELRRGARAPAPQLAPVPRGPGEVSFPLSFAQERLWFLDQFQPGDPLYNIPAVVGFEGDLDRSALARALNQVVRRHESMRTTFRSEQGRPLQVIAETLHLEIPEVDLTALPGALREREAERQVHLEVRRPFDLAHGPLLRFALLRSGGAGRVTALVTLHHIIADAWSMWVFLRDLSASYGAFADGRAPSQPPLPIQYADFAHWQRRQLSGAAFEEQLAYWKDQLAGVDPLLELPSDRPRPPVMSHRGARRDFRVPDSLAEELRDLGRRRGATLFMTLLAAFATLLYRVSGQARLVVGTPVANRQRRELEDLIGFLINTLALRIDFVARPSFDGLLEQVREVALGAYAHQDLPFEKLVGELGLDREMNHPPLVQAMFGLETNAEPLSFSDLALSPRGGVRTETAKFDLTLTMVEDGTRLSGHLIYSSDLFDPTTVERLGDRLRRLLAAAAAAPHEPVGILAGLSPGERHQLLVDWNDPDTCWPEPGLMHRPFEAMAKRRGDAVAVVGEDTALSYRELDDRADRIADLLHSRGVGPEAVVALYLERSPALLAALLGVWKAGGAFVPVEASYPEARIARMLGETDAAIVVSGGELAAPARSFGRPLLDLGGATPTGERAGVAGASPPRPRTDPSNLAYVLFTSGTTGHPKGVMISHRTLSNRVLYAVAAGQVREDDRVQQRASISFDLSLIEIFSTLSAGARLVMARPDGVGDPAYLARLVAREGVSVAFFTPALLQALLREPGIEGCRSLRAVSSSASTLSVELQNRFFEVLDAQLLNRYGPTETTISVTAWTCEPGHARRSVPIGRPMAGVHLYILDACWELAGVGVTGELVLGGPPVGRGYWRRPELTAPVFVPDAWATEEGARAYRTGDLARYLPDGDVEFLGRRDHQVKIRGFRVELGEIEKVLEEHPAVHEAVVIDRAAAGSRQLVAYVAGDAARSAELRAHLAGHLPDYMVPRAVVALDELPRMPNGKVDRFSLPEPVAAGDGGTSLLEPIEEVVAGIWSEVLDLDANDARVATRDANFFELGGHSLLATQVLSRLRETLGTELPLRALFEAATLRELARRVESARRGFELPPLVAVPRDHGIPLSFAQQRLWFADQLLPGDPSYNVPTAVRLRGRLDSVALEGGLRELVERHEVLRTVFPAVDGEPAQEILPADRIRMHKVDLRSLGGERRETLVRRWASDEARQPFDLARGPLVRAHLLKLDDEDHVLLMTLHHIVADGWSTGILVREMAALYGALSQGLATPLPKLAVQYADFAHWQRSWLRGELLEEHLAWWRRQLAGAPARLALPTDRARPEFLSYRGAIESFEVPAEQRRELLELGRREGTTPFMTLLAAFQVLLSRLSGQEDIVVGTNIAGRSARELEPLVGFFVNNLALRGRLADDISFRDFLHQVREVSLAAFEHQDLPFEMLVEALSVERSATFSPLFQVHFLYQNLPPRPEIRISELTLEPLEVAATTSKFDLSLFVHEAGDTLQGTFAYRTDLFEPRTIRRWIGNYQVLLEQIVHSPDAPVAALSLAEEERYEELVDAFNVEL